MNRKVRTALYACALMAPLILQSCNAQSEKKESNKECTEETNKNFSSNIDRKSTRLNSSHAT